MSLPGRVFCFALLPRWGLPAAAGPGCARGVCSAAFLAHPGQLGAARENVLGVLRPFLDAMPVLADPGYEGAGHGVHVPVKSRPGFKELDINARARNALLRSARCQGERSFALLTQRWRTLQHVTACHGRIGLIARAALVPVLFEHKMIK